MLYKMGSICEAVLMAKCFNDLYGKRFSVTIELAIFLTVNIILLECIDCGCLPQWCSLFIYPLIGIYCIGSFKVSIRNILINYALCFIVLRCMQGICAFLIYFCAKNYVRAQEYRFFVQLTMLVIYLIISKFVSFNAISEYLQRQYIKVNTFLITGFILIIIGSFIIKFRNTFNRLNYVSFFICMIIIFAFSVSWAKNKEKSIQSEAQLNAYRLYESSYEKLIGEIRSKQHEFNNHISTIYNQHYMYKDYDSLVAHQKQYCEKVVEDNKCAKLLKLEGSVLIGFLYGKFLEAEKKDITVSCEIGISDRVFEIPDFRLVEILGNFIDNAMEELEQSDIRKMNVKMYSDGGYGYITVENVGRFLDNSEISKMFDRGYSKKGLSRGIGLYNVRHLSEKYDFDVLCGNVLKEGENWIYFTVKKKLGMDSE